MAVEQPPRKLRADAARNRERVLEAAREVFAEHGVGVPIDDVARRAGVGVGTVYRHFPTKESLFEAILVDSIERMSASAREAAEADDPGQAFFEFLWLVTGHGGENMALADALADSGPRLQGRLAPAQAGLRGGLRGAPSAGPGRRGGARRRRAGRRPDVAAAAPAGPPAPTTAARERSRRLIAIVADGLRA